MADTDSIVDVVTVDPACPHENLKVERQIRRSGSGHLLHIKSITCADPNCNAVLYMLDAHGRAGTQMMIPVLDRPPMPLTAAAQQAKEATARPTNARARDTLQAVGQTLTDEQKEQRFFERLDKIGKGPGTESLKDFHKMGMIDCSECWRLAGLMNKWGVEKCRGEKLAYIVEDAVERAEVWWLDPERATFRAKLAAWWQSGLSTVDAIRVQKAINEDVKEGLRLLLSMLFTAAIDRAEKLQLTEA